MRSGGSHFTHTVLLGFGEHSRLDENRVRRAVTLRCVKMKPELCLRRLMILCSKRENFYIVFRMLTVHILVRFKKCYGIHHVCATLSFFF